MPSAYAMLLLALASCATSPATPRVRPACWAQPVPGADVDNWYEVTPELFRCGQPSAAGMRELERFGVASIVNLRQLHSDEDEIVGTGLQLFEVGLAAGHLSYDELAHAVATIAAAPKPVAVHCWHGADRTGAVIAAWRVAVDGWSPAAAADEMLAGGYGHHRLFGNLRRLIEGLDAAKLRRDLAASLAARGAN